MLDAKGCLSPAGVTCVSVGAGVPGSRAQFAGEVWLAKRGVESVFGGSKSKSCRLEGAGPSPHICTARVEPLMSQPRSWSAGPVRRPTPRVFEVSGGGT